MRIIERENRSAEDVKNEIISCKGKSILISEFNKQGRKIKEYTGEIVDTYASVFLVKVNTNNYLINKSFAYVEFLTRDRHYEIQE